MADEPHEVVKLLLARMESHPEEFEGGMSNRHTRWRRALEDVFSNLTGEEAKPLKSALSKIRLDEIHKNVMEELLNGDERRAMEKEQMRIDSSGSVGIGNITPVNRLSVGSLSSYLNVVSKL